MSDKGRGGNSDRGRARARVEFGDSRGITKISHWKEWTER